MSLAQRNRTKPPKNQKFFWVSLVSPLFMWGESIPFCWFFFFNSGKGMSHPGLWVSVTFCTCLKDKTHGTREKTGTNPNPSLEKGWRCFSQPASHFARNDLEDGRQKKGSWVRLPRQGGERDIGGLEDSHRATLLMFPVNSAHNVSLHVFLGISGWKHHPNEAVLQ